MYNHLPPPDYHTHPYPNGPWIEGAEEGRKVVPSLFSRYRAIRVRAGTTLLHNTDNNDDEKLNNSKGKLYTTREVKP